MGNKNGTPLFSIVIPVYNTAHYIAEALTSVLGQTTDDYEIIVVNDGSPDTAQLEAELQPYLADIIYLKRENGGPAAARNSGIRAAKGEYVAFLDSDDQWVPTHLAQMRQTLRSDPTLDLMYADAVNFGDVAEEGTTTMEANPSDHLATFESLVLCKCTVVGSTVVARRKALVDAGLFDENLAQAEDFDLWARVAYRGGRIDYTRNVHARRRIHKGNLTSDAIGCYGGQATALRKLLRELDLPDVLRSEMEKEIEKCEAAVALEKSKQQLAAGRYEEAVVELKRANASYQSRKLQLVLYLMRTTPGLVRHMYLKQRTKGSRSRTRILLKSVGL